MRQAKHAERRVETRRRLELGEAVEAAGAAHLSRNDIIEALSSYLETSFPERASRTTSDKSYGALGQPPERMS